MWNLCMKRLVLHVYQDFYPKRGGIEDHILTLAQANSTKYEHVVLTASAGRVTTREKVWGVSVVRVGSWGRYYTPFCPSMAAWIRQLEPDLLHLHHPSPMAFVGYLQARPQAPMVVGYHNDIVRPKSLLALYRPLQGMVLRCAAAILVGTQSYLDASPFLGRFRAKCRVLPYGIQLAMFESDPKVEQRAATFRARLRHPVLLFVGRLCYYKGLADLINAMKAVDASLLIVGRGPLQVQLERQIWAAGLEGKVKLVGAVDDVELPAYYRASDLLVLPSTHTSEAFGLVMLQAQACSRPVICSDLPGLSTVNRHGETGLLVPPRDPAALAKAIRVLLASPARCRQMGRVGRQQVEQHYSAERMVQRMEAVYDRL